MKALVTEKYPSLSFIFFAVPFLIIYVFISNTRFFYVKCLGQGTLVFLVLFGMGLFLGGCV